MEQNEPERSKTMSATQKKREKTQSPSDFDQRPFLVMHGEALSKAIHFFVNFYLDAP